MKGTVNKVFIIGRLGQEPQIRYMPNGTAVLSISLATNDGYKDSQTGQFIDNTEWHNVTIFGKKAEIVTQYRTKGDLLHVEGRLRTQKWQDKATGQDRYKTDIVANEIELIGQSSEQVQQQPQGQVPVQQPQQFQQPSNQQIQPPIANKFAHREQQQANQNFN